MKSSNGSSAIGAVFILSLAGCGGNDPGPAVETQDVATAPDDRPNIILIVADDMGFTDLGSFGGEIPTPNLDELAYAGIRLTNFHAAPVCAPARAMLLSGMDNHEAGIGSMTLKRFYDNGTAPNQDIPGYGQPGYEGYLSYRVAALPEVLRDAGYRTYMAGKWDLGRALVEEHNPAGRGFESSFALTTGSALHLGDADGSADGGVPRADPLVYRENWDVVELLPEDFFSTEMFTDKIMEYIGDHRDDGRPFFAYLALSAPHWPLQVPEDWRDRFTGDYDEGYDAIRDRRVRRAVEQGVLPPEARMDGYRRRSTPWSSLDAMERIGQSRRMELYAAMVAHMDFHIGRLVAYLREIGEFENTFILFMSDNGASGSSPAGMSEGFDNSLANMGDVDSFVDYGMGWAEAAMAPYRDVKSSMAEGGVLAAAFATHGPVASAGGVSRQYLTMQDVMPTLLRIAETEDPVRQYNNRPILPMRGKSFLGILQGDDAAVHDAAESIGWELSGERALVRGNWKLLWMPSAGEETRWELFDLSADPFERNDVSAQHPDTMADLIGAWNDYAEEVGVVTGD